MLHLNNVQFLSSHSSPPSLLFPLPSSKFSTVPFPTPFRRTTSSSTLRFRSHSHSCRIRNSATNDKLNETEQKKKPVNRAYPFHEIEPKWQRFWDEFRTFRTPDDDIDTSKPKYYILDMFPYPRFSIEVTFIFQFLDLYSELQWNWDYYPFLLQWSWVTCWTSTWIHCDWYSS